MPADRPNEESHSATIAENLFVGMSSDYKIMIIEPYC